MVQNYTALQPQSLRLIQSKTSLRIKQGENLAKERVDVEFRKPVIIYMLEIRSGGNPIKEIST